MSEIGVIDLDSDSNSFHEIALYECDYCSKCFKSREDLQKHFSKYHVCSDLSCNSCRQQGKSSKLLPNIKKEIINGLFIQSTTSQPIANLATRDHSVPVSLNQSIAFCSNPENTIRSEVPHNCECESGRETTKSILVLPRAKKHIFFCIECDMTFNKRTNLKRHEKTHSDFPVKQSFKCCVCNSSFANKFNLQRHEKLHSPHKSYSCSICSMLFAHQYYLSAHLSSHSDFRLFECQECTRLYKTKYGLNKHKRKHSECLSFEEIGSL